MQGVTVEGFLAFGRGHFTVYSQSEQLGAYRPIGRTAFPVMAL